jgi:preprotein translocase subunit Sec61beta
MTYDENQNTNLDIDPAMLIMGVGYATSLIVLIGWVASFTL